MKFNYNLTNKVEKFITDCTLEEIGIGCSDSQVFKILKHDDIYYLKMAKKGILTSEYEKLKWLNGKLKVPKLVLYDISDDTEYLITKNVNGEMVCSDYYINNPDEGLNVIVEAFKQLNQVDITKCPFDVSIDYKLSLIKNNIENGLIEEQNLKPETLKKYGNLKNILKYLQENKFDDQLVFSHGDTSLPNIFGEKKEFKGFIDVGECGLADKWFDLAICEKSIKRNYGESYISKFYQKLNIRPERKKLDYYLLMMELYL